MEDQNCSLPGHSSTGASLDPHVRVALQQLESKPPLPIGFLTCEALREELRFFAQEGALKRQLVDVETRLREKMHAELQDLLGELRDCQTAWSPLATSHSDVPRRRGEGNPHARKEPVNFNMRGYHAMHEIREMGEEQAHKHHGHGHGHGHRRKSLFAFPESIIPQGAKADRHSEHRDGGGERAGSDPQAELVHLHDVQSRTPQVDRQSKQSVISLVPTTRIKQSITTSARTSDRVEVVPHGRDSTPSSAGTASRKVIDSSSKTWATLPTKEGADEGNVSLYSSTYRFQSTSRQSFSKSDSDSEIDRHLLSLARGSCCPWTRQSSFMIVHSGWFDYAIGLAILANAVQIGIQTDFNARKKYDKTPAFFRVMELSFCVLFTFELILRLLSESTRFFCMKGWQWNLFDTVVVSIQLLEELMTLTSTSSPWLNLSFLRVLRVLRLVRVIRLVRILRLIGELRTLIMSILSSLRSLGWTILLLFLMIYFFSVCFTQLVADHEGDSHSDLHKYYGTLDSTILALFQSITGGVDWQAVVEPLMETLGPWYALIFSFYIAFAVLAVLNVVTGVFVESALLSAKKDEDFFMINNVRELFELVTWDRAEGLGKRADELAMTWEDFRSKLSCQQMQDYFRSIDVDLSDAYCVFHLLDTDGSGSVTFEEFVSNCCKLKGNAKSLDVHILLYELRRLTDMFDRNCVEMEGFARIFKTWRARKEQSAVSSQEGTSSEQTHSTVKTREDSFQLAQPVCDDVEVLALGDRGSGESETKQLAIAPQTAGLERDRRPRLSGIPAHKRAESLFNKTS